MKLRSITISGIAIVIAIVAMATLLISNKPEAEGGGDGGAYGKVNYRTYSYGMDTDATASYSTLLSLYQNGQRSSYICMSLEHCGNSFYLNGYYAKAFEAYIMAMEMAEEIGSRQRQTSCYYNIGNIYVIFKDYERAACYYEKVLALPATEQRKSTRSLAARYLVMCYSRTGDHGKAALAFRKARQMPLSDKNINAYYDLYCSGLMLEQEGRYGQALEMHQKAYAITRRHGMKIGMGAYPLSECGRILTAQGRTDEAIRMQRMAMQVAREEKAFDQLDDAYVALDSLFRGKGCADSAMVYQNLHMKLAGEMFDNTEFFAARNKLINYEDGVKNRRINILEQKVNLMTVGIVMFVVILAVILFYSQKLRKAYRMLTLKNQQLIEQQDANRELATEYLSAGAKGRCHEEDTARNVASEKDGPTHAEATDGQLLGEIIEVMNDTEAICDSDFSLQTLAKRVRSNTKYVSVAISTTRQGSFKALLNEYRIREACRRLADKAYDAYTIQAVAETVGYVSVNNFIVQFKRYTGMTPSIYRKNARPTSDRARLDPCAGEDDG